MEIVLGILAFSLLFGLVVGNIYAVSAILKLLKIKSNKAIVGIIFLTLSILNTPLLIVATYEALDKRKGAPS